MFKEHYNAANRKSFGESEDESNGEREETMIGNLQVDTYERD